MSFTAKILLLGSGELGKEFAISAKRLGAKVVACDSSAGAAGMQGADAACGGARRAAEVAACGGCAGGPAMQVADAAEVFPMLDGARLREAAERHRPDFIVPEVEAIRTSMLVELEQEGFNVVPSARATAMTMNR